MSASVSPASATAARQASTVSDERSGASAAGRSSDMPTPVIATRSSNRSSLAFGRTATSGSGGSATRGRAHRTTVGRRCEERQPDVLLLLEPDLHPQTDVHVVGLRIDDVGREADTRVLVERHDRDDVRRREVREPLLAVDREPDDRAAPDTAAGSSSRCWHAAHTVCDGCQRRAQAGHRLMQSRPSRPPVQKASVSGSTRGSGRTVVLRPMAVADCGGNAALLRC